MRWVGKWVGLGVSGGVGWYGLSWVGWWVGVEKILRLFGQRSPSMAGMPIIASAAGGCPLSLPVASKYGSVNASFA